MQRLLARETPSEKVPELGWLEPTGNGGLRVELWEKIVIPGAGRYIKKETLPLLRESELEALLTEKGLDYSEERCVGALLPHREGNPIGQLFYEKGWFCYAMPVYRLEDVDDGWKPAGYLPVSEGKFAVVARRSRAGLIGGVLFGAVLIGALAVQQLGGENILAWFRSLI